MPNPENPIIAKLRVFDDRIFRRAGEIIYKIQYGETYPFDRQDLVEGVKDAIIGLQTITHSGQYSVLAYSDVNNGVPYSHVKVSQPVQISSADAVVETDLRLNPVGIQMRTWLSQDGITLASREDIIVSVAGKLKYLGNTSKDAGLYLSRDQAMILTDSALIIARQIKETGLIDNNFEQLTLNPGDFLYG